MLDLTSIFYRIPSENRKSKTVILFFFEKKERKTVLIWIPLDQ